MIDTSAFTKLVPGFDFLNTLMQSAGQAAPAMGQWIAPTLNPDELEKRISELKTLQFWLEQNARIMGMTVQALEVQRMTLSTLKTMILPMAELRSALTLPTATAAAAKPPPPAPAPPPEQPKAEAEPASAASGAAPAEAAAQPAGVDPVQWWGALTQQFTELATKAMQDGSALASRSLAAAPVAAAPTKADAAKVAAKPAAKSATKAPRKRA